MNFDILRNIYGKRITYNFDIPDVNNSSELLNVLEDQWQRMKHFKFIKENIELDITCYKNKGSLGFIFEFCDHENIEDFITKYNNKINDYLCKDILDDGLCLANCGFYRTNSFCSIHSDLFPDDFIKSHSEFLRNKLFHEINDLEKFIKEPLPKIYEYEISGNNWKYNLIMRLNETFDE